MLQIGGCSRNICVSNEPRKSQYPKIRSGAYYITNHDYDHAANTPCSHSPPCPTMPPPQKSKLMSKVRPFRSLPFRKLYNALGPSELKLQISITTDKTVLELKQAIAEKSDVGADRQRLIYSGSCPCSRFASFFTNLLLSKDGCSKCVLCLRIAFTNYKAY